MHHSWDNKEGSHKGKFQFDVKDFRAFYSTIRSVRCKTKTSSPAFSFPALTDYVDLLRVLIGSLCCQALLSLVAVIGLF